MKKTIKKILMAMCLIAMTATAAACGSNNAASSSSSSAGSSGVQQTVFNERATESSTKATENSTKATEKGTEKATEKKSGTGFGSSKSDKDKKSKSSKSDKDKKSSSSKSDKDKKNSSSKSDKKNSKNKSNNNSSGNGGEITYYYTTTTTGGSNSSASNQNSNSGSTGKSNNSSSSQADPHAGKTWHEAEYKVINHPAETEKVWVVDQPATTKEEPVYETHGVYVCNDCGADITNAAYRKKHLIAHIEAGESGSYHVEERRVQTGTKTVKVPEKGHWEKRIVKPAWTEKKLVREAGWY